MGRQREMVRLTSWKSQEQAHTHWRWADKKKWSGQLHGRIKNKHIPAENGQTRRNGQVIFMGRVKNKHISAEDEQTRRNGQVNIMEGSRTSTYLLKMNRQREMIRSTSWKGSRTSTYLLKMGKQGEMVRSTSWKGSSTYPLMDRQGEMVRSTSWKGSQQQAHTRWGWENKEKWSGQLHRRVKNKHIPPENGQIRRNSQVNFMEWLRTSTYPLKMGRQEKIVRSTLWKGQKQAHTSWRWADKEKGSGQLHGRIKNKHIPAKDGQTRRNGQVDFMKGSRTGTYLLKMSKQGEMVRSTSWKGQEQAHTPWRWVDKKKWSDWLHGRVKNKHIPPEDGQTKRNGQMDFMEGSRTSTYPLKMGRQKEIVRSTSWKDQEAHTHWRWADKEKRSGQLHGRIKNKHIPTENGQTVRSTSWKGQEQALPAENGQTGKNGQVNVMKRVKNKHIPAENEQTRRNAQIDFIEGSRTSTYPLKMGRQGEMVRSISWKGQE